MLSALIIALAVQAAPPAAKTDEKPVGYYDKVLCKRIEATGTRLGGKRLCMTRRDWDARAALDRDALEKERNQGFSSSPIG